MEERLKRRKLDALKRGVHRITGGDNLPVTSHVIGIGKAGAAVILEILRALDPGAPKFTALAIDIGGYDLAALRVVAAGIPPDHAEVTIVALDMPDRANLFSDMLRYRDFLRLEYPNYRWNPAYEPWLPSSLQLPSAETHLPRAVAKAVYGCAYYGGQRPMEHALRRFAAGIEAIGTQPIVSIVFGLAGGTGSGIAADLARHLSNGIFGRRVLVAGIGIAPCDDDPPAHIGGHLFPALNELDCMGDENKNRGIVMSCGELFRNPYTAGFLIVPQQHLLGANADLAAAQRRVDREIADLLTIRCGVHMLELLRLLNWVAAPSTQHSAARTPWGPRWIHLLAFTDIAFAKTDLRANLGLLPGYQPEFLEIRVPDVTTAATADLVEEIAAEFLPDVPPQLVDGSRAGSAQFVLPCLSKFDLKLFFDSRDAYGAQDDEARLLGHSLLLEQGVELCEPSSQLNGMAGASLWGGDAWVAVPFDELYGPTAPASSPPALQSLRQLREAV